MMSGLILPAPGIRCSQDPGTNRVNMHGLGCSYVPFFFRVLRGEVKSQFLHFITHNTLPKTSYLNLEKRTSSVILHSLENARGKSLEKITSTIKSQIQEKFKKKSKKSCL